MQAALQGFFDIFFLWQLTKGFDDLTIAQRSAVNTLIMGLIYIQTKAGRCGEWQEFRMVEVKQKFVDEGSNCQLHGIRFHSREVSTQLTVSHAHG